MSEQKPRPGGLGRELLVTQVLVIATMAATVLVVAALIGPPVFTEHLQQTGHANQPLVMEHARQAFFLAGLTALAVGCLAAALGALTLSRRLTRWLTSGLDALHAGATRVGAGEYDQRVQLPATAPELQAVAAAFNTMAAELATTETRRRRLLTDIGHELRTPIAAIEVILEGWAEGIIEPDAETLRALRSQSQRLARLTADVRDVSAAEEGRLDLHRESIMTSAVAEAAVAAAAPGYAEAGVRLHRSGTSEALLADRSRLGQVLDNLLSNALRHTPAGGSVTITSGRDSQSVWLAVADTGEGITAHDLPHLFERFYRAGSARSRGPGQGTGVGLSISRAIVRAHGGDLTAESAGPGRGATFTVHLPATR